MFTFPYLSSAVGISFVNLCWGAGHFCFRAYYNNGHDVRHSHIPIKTYSITRDIPKAKREIILLGFLYHLGCWVWFPFLRRFFLPCRVEIQIGMPIVSSPFLKIRSIWNTAWIFVNNTTTARP